MTQDNGDRPPGRNARSRKTARMAARLAPPEEGEPGPRRGPVDDTIRLAAEDLDMPLSAEDENEARGLFYLPPVVLVTVSVFFAYLLVMAWLITDMPARE